MKKTILFSVLFICLAVGLSLVFNTVIATGIHRDLPVINGGGGSPPAPEPDPEPDPEPEAGGWGSCSCPWSSWQSLGCGWEPHLTHASCAPTRRVERSTRACEPYNCDPNKEGQEKFRCPRDSSCCPCTGWSDWENTGCGFGDCGEDKMEQKKTRVCTPNWCRTHNDFRCHNDSSCNQDASNGWGSSCQCGEWSDYVDFSCGSGDGDCPQNHSYQRATKTCDPAGCETEERFQCGTCSTSCIGKYTYCVGFLPGQDGNCQDGYTCGDTCDCVPKEYNLSVNAVVDGELSWGPVLSGSLSGGGRFAYESDVTVSADSIYSENGINYKFSSWSGYCNSDEPEFTFSMPNHDTSCTANYEKEKLGTLSISYSGTFEDQFGNALNLGSTGPEFSVEYRHCEQRLYDGKLCTYPERDGGVIPPGGYTLTLPAADEQSWYEVSVSFGESISLWPPNPYICHLISASCSGNSKMTEAGIACTAVYGNCQYCCSGPDCSTDPELYSTLTTSSTDGGSITSPGEGEFTYEKGDSVTVLYSADENCSFDSWSGDCTGTGSCQVIMNSDKAVMAHFECDTLLTVSCSASPNPAKINENVTFTASAQGGTGSYTYSWSGSCSGTQKSYARPFSSAGTYACAVKVTSGSEEKTSPNCSVVVEACNCQCVEEEGGCFEGICEEYDYEGTTEFMRLIKKSIQCDDENCPSHGTQTEDCTDICKFNADCDDGDTCDVGGVCGS